VSGEWAIVGGVVCVVWIGCFACCCRRTSRSADEANDAAPAASLQEDAPSTAWKGSTVRFEIRPSVVPPPPLDAPPALSTIVPPPPPPAGCGPGIRPVNGSSVWREHVDPSSGDKFYEDENGFVTWDEPPDQHVVTRA
jgi:hypothetical protein